MRILFKFAVLAVCLAVAVGCASNANQKINAPMIGFVKHEYYLYNIKVDGESAHVITNMMKKIAFGGSISNSVRQTSDGMVTLGHGTSLLAVDNQVLVGRDIGNATSNDVNGSISIPLGR